MSKILVWDEERQKEADRQYDICRLEALMMNLETMAILRARREEEAQRAAKAALEAEGAQ